MSWRFRKSFELFPGVKINMSKTGLSASIGSGPLHVNLSERGILGTASLIGTGISYRQYLDRNKKDPEIQNNHIQQSIQSRIERHIIQSANCAEITSPGLDNLHTIIFDALRERNEIDAILDGTRRQYAEYLAIYEKWRDGIIKKWLFESRYLKIRKNLELEAEKIAELEEQRRLTVVQAEIEVPEKAVALFDTLRNSFQDLADSKGVWDIVASTEVSEKKSLRKEIERYPVAFGINTYPVLSSRWEVPFLGNYNGGSIYIYPGFLFYNHTRLDFAVIDIKELKVELYESRFTESNGLPNDATVLEYVWEKSNADGSPDKRYKENARFPICKYAVINLSTDSGLNERFMFSNYMAAKNFFVDISKLIQFYTEN